MKKVVILFAFLAGVLASQAYDFSAVAPTGQTLYYNILSDSSLTVEVTCPGNYWSGYTKPTDSLSIPSMVSYGGNSYSVSAIGDNAFYYCDTLSSVTIPNSVATIGHYAFSNCSGLVSVTIPDSVTSIGIYTFQNCIGLTSVTFNAINCMTTSVTIISMPIFEGCTSLTSITIGEQVTTIPSRIFDGCRGLTSVTIPNSVVSIGACAFQNCSGLTSVIIPNSVTTIGGSAFSGCSGLTSMVIPNSVTSIGGSAFRDCSGLTSIVIPNSVMTIGVYAFSGCSGLTSVVIPNSVTSIGGYAFSGCSGLASIAIPNSVTSIMEGTFSGCSGLTSVTIPNSVTSIGWQVFSGCSGLTSVTIGNSVTSIGRRVFYGCSSLDTLYYNAEDFVSDYDWGNTSSNYDDCGFRCLNLHVIIIGNNVQTLPYGAFYGQDEISSVKIPNSMTWIAGYAFYNCSSLRTIYSYNTTAPSLGLNTFYGCAIQDVFIPCGSHSSYNSSWYQYGAYLEETATFAITLHSADSSMGEVSFLTSVCVDPISIAATSNYGYHFTQWSDGVTDNPRTFVLTQDTSFTAQFGYNSYAVIKVCDTLQGNVMGEDSADYLSNVVLTAEPNYGYHFTQWSDGVTDNPRTFVLTQDTTFVAEFDRNSYAVTCVSNDVSMGQVQGGGTFLYLDTIVLTAEAVEPYRFTHWQDGDTVNPRSIVVYSDSTFTAYFENSTEGIETVQKSYTLTVVGNAIRISGAMGETMRVFDVVGRQLLIKKLDSEEILLDQTGVFFVQVGNAPAEKVVLVR